MDDPHEGLEHWIARARTAAGEPTATVDVDALLALASAAARSGLRPLAPVSCAIWGVACASHPDRTPQELHRALVDTFHGFGQPEEAQDDPALWQVRVAQACRSVQVDPALVDVALVQATTRAVAHATARPMAPVCAHLLGRAVGSGRDGALVAARLRDALER